MKPTDFAAFFESVHERPPFPWQVRLAEEVVSGGRWPDLLDLPTGVGKTSAIDVALFALALRPEVFPRRILLVVDRRVVVDQGAEHARRIQRRLGNATDGVAGAVASGLRSLFGGEADELPFAVSVLRGGMPRDEAWAARPDRPVVGVSTVDQVGSRLLFRGYGVSPRAAPIHAGLLGHDTLFLLDEVQLSTAFAETLGALERRWRRWHGRQSSGVLPDRWGVVRMSATPIGEQEHESTVFRLDEEDRSHEVLSRRLDAQKLTTGELVTVTGDEDRRVHRFSTALAEEAGKRLAEGAVAVAVVVNRVDTARRVHAILAGQKRRTFDVALLTGRARPLDRVDLLGDLRAPGSLLSRISAGRRRDVAARPVVVVATQSIEAGADFDFDGMVTECASLDALRQRLGRLDRLGELGITRCTILARSDQVKAGAVDPIYGGALAATWEWLDSAQAAAGQDEGVDLGTTGCPEMPQDDVARIALLSAVVRAPIMLPAHLDAWTQTNPRPAPDPDVALWLHGPQRDVKEVQIVWRADLDASELNGDLEPGRGSSAMARRLAPQLAVCPPSSLESLTVPLHAARAWLARTAADSFGDVEGALRMEDGDDSGSKEARRARRSVRLRRESPEIIEAPDLRPGDTIVVPSTYGGIAHGNWDPDATAFVTDLGDWAQLVHRGRPTLRLVPEVLAGPTGEMETTGGVAFSSGHEYWCPSGIAHRVPAQPGTDELGTDLSEAVSQWLKEVRGVAGARLRVLLEALSSGGAGRPSYRRLEIAGGRFALVAKRRLDPRRFLLSDQDQIEDLRSEDDDSGSFADNEVTLHRHLEDVEGLVRLFAENLGIGAELASDLALAGVAHDVGKADPRFQQMLLGGNEVRLALQEGPLAKSSGFVDAASRKEARIRAGYPGGYRHEHLSVAMLEESDLLREARDKELVLHLVGSHHGWCRPFVPAVDSGPDREVGFAIRGHALRAGTAHRLARLDSGVADRFWRLTERYGWWGLAWLESILRLADHRASEAESQGVDP